MSSTCPSDGSSPIVRQVLASSETWMDPASARRIHARIMRLKVHPAPRSTYTHSSPVPALFQALVKSKGPLTCTRWALSKKDTSPNRSEEHTSELQSPYVISS